MKQYRRIYAIPDLHGRSDLLDEALLLLDKEGMDLNQDALVVLGDMIDRGPDSNGVLSLLIKLQKDHKNVIVLRGNHEDLAIDYYVRKYTHSMDAWYMNGGRYTEWSYKDCRMSEEHIKYIASLPYSFEADGFFFSHAPVPREKTRLNFKKKEEFREYSVNELTWTYMGPECDREGALFHQHEGPKSDNGTGEKNRIGVCGHIHRGKSVKQVRLFPNYRMLDCGAGCWESAPLAVHECHENKTYYISKETSV